MRKQAIEMMLSKHTYNADVQRLMKIVVKLAFSDSQPPL